MKRALEITALAALVLLFDLAPGHAAKKANSGSSANAAKIECMKQYGATCDGKRCTMSAPYYIMASRLDAVDRCVAQRTGKAIAPVMREQTTRP